MNSKIYLNLLIRDIQRIEKLLEVLSPFVTRQAVSYNVTLKLVRANIIAEEKEYILHVLNASF